MQEKTKSEAVVATSDSSDFTRLTEEQITKTIAKVHGFYFSDSGDSVTCTQCRKRFMTKSHGKYINETMINHYFKHKGIM